MTARTDASLGAAALLGGALYFQAAAGIEDSLLSDAIGAGGVPMGIAALVMVSGGLQLLRGLSRLRAEPPGAVAWHAHRRALGLLGLLAGYMLVVPWLGYAPAVLLLALAVAAYAGAPRGLSLLGFGIGTAAVLWAAFVAALGVPFPPGRLFG